MTAMSATAGHAPLATSSISEHAWGSEPPRLGVRGYVTCFKGIVWREVLRYLHQRERFMSALVRPLIWLFIAGAVLVIVTLVAFGSTSGGKPGQHYVPPVMKDGKIVPGHID